MVDCTIALENSNITYHFLITLPQARPFFQKGKNQNHPQISASGKAVFGSLTGLGNCIFTDS